MKIKLIQHCVIDGAVHFAGTELDLPDEATVKLLNQGKAVALKEATERAVQPDKPEKAVRG